jgi:lipid-A-disaccharide synthase
LSETILIIAGENSGEKYGAALVRQYLKNHPETCFFGVGGKAMKKAGVDILFPVEDLAVVGLFEVVSHLARIKRIFRYIQKEVKSRAPSAAVLIDSPDFNLRLAKKLSSQQVPVLYYISPTVWAWRKKRLRTIKKHVSRMLLIFPFEEDIYLANEIPSAFIGHPLIEKVKIGNSRESFLKKYGLDPDKHIISILPGSRKSEIRFHAPVLNKTLPRIRKELNVQFIMLQADNISREYFISCFSQTLHYCLVSEDIYDALAYSRLALSSCGTANLEAALLETPVIAFYRLSPLTYFLGVRFIKIKNYSIVNILAQEKIIPELIQGEFTEENLYNETKKIMNSASIRNSMIEQFQIIRKQLGTQLASKNAAAELFDLISS